MIKSEKYLMISELSKLTGISIPRIRYYIQKNILPQPIKINKTTAYYSSEHVERLEIIKEMHDERKIPLSSIERMIHSLKASSGEARGVHDNAAYVVKERIINSCIPIFRKKGYARTTITDIAESAGISRNTFYQHFSNKKGLFLECIDKIFIYWRSEAPDESASFIDTLRIMVFAFQEKYSEWSDMMNLLRATATVYPSDFADKLEMVMTKRIQPIVADIKQAAQKGEIREVNAEILGIMMAGSIDYLTYFQDRGKFSDKTKLDMFKEEIDIWINGIK